MESTTKKAVQGDVGTSKGPWTARETGFECSCIEYKPQEVQCIDEKIDDLESMVQELFRYGTSSNRDLFAMKLNGKLEELRESVECGRMM